MLLLQSSQCILQSLDSILMHAVPVDNMRIECIFRLAAYSPPPLDGLLESLAVFRNNILKPKRRAAGETVCNKFIMIDTPPALLGFPPGVLRTPRTDIGMMVIPIFLIKFGVPIIELARLSSQMQQAN